MTPATFTLFPDEPRERVQDWLDRTPDVNEARGSGGVAYTADCHGAIHTDTGDEKVWVGSWEQTDDDGTVEVRIDR